MFEVNSSLSGDIGHFQRLHDFARAETGRQRFQRRMDEDSEELHLYLEWALRGRQCALREAPTSAKCPASSPCTTAG